MNRFSVFGVRSSELGAIVNCEFGVLSSWQENSCWCQLSGCQKMAGRIRYVTQTELKKAIDNLIDGLTDEEESVVDIGAPGGQVPRDISLVQNAIITFINLYFMFHEFPPVLFFIFSFRVKKFAVSEKLSESRFICS